MRRIAFLLTLLGPSIAWAQTDNPTARAQSLFEQGVAAARSGDYASACPKFAASQRLDPKTSTLLNLASCYELAGQSASAWASFKEAEASARKHGRTDWAERAAAAVKNLEPKLVRLTVHVPPRLSAIHLDVELDGTALHRTEWEQPLPVDPGEHRVGWRAPEFNPATRSVNVSTTDVEITLTELERATTAASAPPDASQSSTSIVQGETQPGFWSTGRITGVALGSVGVATLITGAVLGLSASAKYDEAEELCGASSGSPRTCLPERSLEAFEARDSASSRAAASTVMFVAGGLLTAGGLALVLLTGPSPSRRVALVPWNAGLATVGTW